MRFDCFFLVSAEEIDLYLHIKLRTFSILYDKLSEKVVIEKIAKIKRRSQDHILIFYEDFQNNFFIVLCIRLDLQG